MHFIMIGFATDSISCISKYVYLVGDQIWIMPLAEVGSRELPYLATTSSAQTTRHASGDSAEPQARGPAPPTM
jgi:hypothetical protein